MLEDGASFSPAKVTGCWMLEEDSQDRFCNGSKFLLLLAAGPGCRSQLGAGSDNEHWLPSSALLLICNQPTTQKSDEPHNRCPPHSLDFLPPGRDWQEVPSSWLGLGLLLQGTFAWRAGKISQLCQTMWRNWLFEVSLAVKPLLGLLFWGT